MFQAGQRFGLAAEASRLARAGDGGLEHLEGRQPLHAQVPRLVDHPHAAVADFAEDLVARDDRQRRARRDGGLRVVGDRPPSGGRRIVHQHRLMHFKVGLELVGEFREAAARTPPGGAPRPDGREAGFHDKSGRGRRHRPRPAPAAGRGTASTAGRSPAPPAAALVIEQVVHRLPAAAAFGRRLVRRACGPCRSSMTPLVQT